MNKRGFAISVILYSIIFLIIAILYMIFGIVKTRYSVSQKLRESVINDLNVVRFGYQYTSSERCEITANSKGYQEDLELTIGLVDGETYGKSYKFNNGSWGSSNTINVDHSGIWIGYFKDKSGGIGSCSTDVKSSTSYRYRECTNYIMGPEYYDSNGVLQPGDVIGCNSYGQWSGWSNTKPPTSPTIQVESTTSYRMIDEKCFRAIECLANGNNTSTCTVDGNNSYVCHNEDLDSSQYR